MLPNTTDNPGLTNAGAPCGKLQVLTSTESCLNSSTLGSRDSIVSSFIEEPSLDGRLLIEFIAKKYWDVELILVRHHCDVDSEEIEIHWNEYGKGMASADLFHLGE